VGSLQGVLLLPRCDGGGAHTPRYCSPTLGWLAWACFQSCTCVSCYKAAVLAAALHTLVHHPKCALAGTAFVPSPDTIILGFVIHGYIKMKCSFLTLLRPLPPLLSQHPSIPGRPPLFDFS
jgi:hypothetical protein